MKNNCVYFHINPVKREVFYVGIGIERRPYSDRNRNKYWHNIVNKYGYNVVIIEKGLTLEEAFKRERFYIKLIGRKDLKLGTLVNMTNGGEGSDGYKHNEEAVIKMKKARVNFKHTEETKSRLSVLCKGKNTWTKGRKYTEEEKRLRREKMARKKTNGK